MRCVYLLASFFVLTLLAKPSMTQQDPKQNETPVGQSQPEFTEVEKAWWKEFEKTEGELIQLEEDKRQALEAVKMQVEKSYRERQDSRLDANAKTRA